jgi:hypothetical protein
VFAWSLSGSSTKPFRHLLGLLCISLSLLYIFSFLLLYTYFNIFLPEDYELRPNPRKSRQPYPLPNCSSFVCPSCLSACWGSNPRRYEKCHSVVRVARRTISSACTDRQQSDISRIRSPVANWHGRQLFPKWKWFNLKDGVGRLERLSSIAWMQSWLAEWCLTMLLTPTKWSVLALVIGGS